MAKVVAVCGMPGSGKGIFGDIAKKLDIPVRSMGDMIRSEVLERGLSENPEIFGQIAQELRDEFGDGFLAARLAPIIDNELGDNSFVIIEGMRGRAERDIFVQYWGNDFSIVAIVAGTETRFSRISDRGRSEDGGRANFSSRDEREIGWGLEELISNAEHVLQNMGTITEFEQNCTMFLKQLS